MVRLASLHQICGKISKCGKLNCSFNSIYRWERSQGHFSKSQGSFLYTTILPCNVIFFAEDFILRIDKIWKIKSSKGLSQRMFTWSLATIGILGKVVKYAQHVELVEHISQLFLDF